MSGDHYTKRLFSPVHNKAYTFYELAINDKFLYEDSLRKLKVGSSDKPKLAKIYALMDMIGEYPLPKTKFRQIKGAATNDLWEFKDKDMRVYVLKVAPKVFVLIAGYKGEQERDIAKLKKIVKNINVKEL